MARILYVLAHSTEAPDRATAALATALAAQRAGHDAAFWLTGEGARLGVKGVAETLNEPYPETAATMRDALLAGGATFHIEAHAFAARQYAPEAVLAGAVVADGAQLATLLDEGWQAVTL
ncbi:MAG: DsrE family protein [Planctomycetota bacterium]|nr:DsrE family protein [Planctomycetota bacterium]